MLWTEDVADVANLFIQANKRLYINREKFDKIKKGADFWSIVVNSYLIKDPKQFSL